MKRALTVCSIGVACAVASCNRDEPKLLEAADDYAAACCACAAGDVDCCERAEEELERRECALGYRSPACHDKKREPSDDAKARMHASRKRAHDCEVRGGARGCGGIKDARCPPGYQCVPDLDQEYDPEGTCVKTTK